MKEKYLLRGIPSIKFAIGSKLRDKIRPDKPKTDNDINIKPVSAKHFFWIVRRKNHKGYMCIPRVLSRNYISKDCTDNSHVAK